MLLISSPFMRFVLVGGVAAIINLVSRYVISFFVGYGYAVIIAYIVGMVTAFFLNRLFVFERATGTGQGQFWRFTLVNILAAAQVWGISVGLAEYVFPMIGFTYRPLEFAHLIGVAFPVLTSYFGHKHFSFRESRDADGIC